MESSHRRPRKWQHGALSDDSDMDDNISFELAMAGESTPLRLPSNLSSQVSPTAFVSPMKKLHNLHLSTSSPEIPIDRMIPIDHSGISDDDGDYSEADQTIGEDRSSEIEFEEDGEVRDGENDEDEDSTFPSRKPVYMNTRKRAMDTSLDMVITPGASSRHRSIDNMSICINDSTSSAFKLSFSNSDSTPCPRQSRKRLKFKNSTPSGTPLNGGKRKNILNFSNSTKASASILTQLHSIKGGDQVNINTSLENENEDEDDQLTPSYEKASFSSLPPSSTSSPVTSVNNSIPKVVLNQQNTPISQSTPANSRAPTPPMTNEEYGDTVNGYKFVRSSVPTTETKTQPTHPYYSYTTPENSTTINRNATLSQELRNSYIRNEPVNVRNLPLGQYQIVGEFPVSAAGLMDEEDGDLHIGDKRINDPYLHGLQNSTKPDQRREEIKIEYFESWGTSQVKLPLLIEFQMEHRQTKEELLKSLNDEESVESFYRYILEEDEIFNAVKKERLKWHPDKWAGNNTMDKDIIDTLSQALNSLVDKLKDL